MRAAGPSRGSCAGRGYRETAVLVDADGATIAALRGDGAGIHTLDSAHDKAYTVRRGWLIKRVLPHGRWIPIDLRGLWRFPRPTG
jgi:Haem-degrading